MVEGVFLPYIKKEVLMRLKKGNIWDDIKNTDVLVVTTNSFIKRNGELVMGRGFALQVKNRFPKVPLLLGEKIRGRKKYGFITVKNETLPFIIGAFQVKYHFKDKADIELIKFSTQKLREFAENNSDKKIKMNFPGIGNGKLKNEYKEILEIISILPNNVEVWKY